MKKHLKPTTCFQETFYGLLVNHYDAVMGQLTINTLLDDYIKYSTLTEDKFKLENKLTDQHIKDYASYLCKKGRWILPSELIFLAIIKNIKIRFFY